MNKTRKLDILQISTFDNKGGAAGIAWALKKKLEEYGHKSPMFVRKKMSIDNNVYQLKRGLDRFFSYMFATNMHFFKNDYILGSNQYREANIIHCHNLHGYYFNLKTLMEISQAKPIIWTLHDMWAVTGHCAYSLDCVKWENGCYKCPYLNIAEKLLWDNTKYLWHKKKEIYKNTKLCIVVPSLWLKKIIKKSILKNHPIFLICYGIDNTIFKKYSKEKTRNKLSLPLDKKIITFVAEGGRNNVWKGQEYIQKIINHYSRSEKNLLLYIGGNQNDQKLSTKNIKYIPFIYDKSLLAQYYSASDVFLLTSLADNFPVVVLEAMACGVPVVSFDVGGVKEAVIHKKNGYIAKYKDTEDLVRGINYIINLDKKELENMSLNSIKRVEKYFTLTTMTKKYIDLYQSLI